jgi:uncharacterized OsmC-like protein
MSEIKRAFEAIVTTLEKNPALGKGTGTTTARLRKGLVCEIEAGPWRFSADMPETCGGTATAPTPGVYGRAALGSCLAIGYAMRAAKLGVSISSITVEVQADYDDGALFGVSDGPPGYSEVRCLVTVETDAPEADVFRALDEADAHSPYLDVFRRAQRCKREVRIQRATA